jgi:PAS domain-containing protein
MAPDLRTVMFIYGIVNIICAGAMIIIWYQSRKTLAGTGFWAMDMILQAVGAILITLRGLVPDLFSIVLANVMISGGIILIYMGLERFAGAVSRQIHNYALLAIFAFLLVYFTYAQPDLMPRQIGIDVATTIFTFQAFWLMVHRVSTHMRPITRIVGVVFGCYALASFARIILHIFFPPQSNDFFKSGLADTMAILVYTMLAVALVFSLTLMVNRRLLGEVKSQEEKFTRAFKSSPYAIALTMPADGRILEFNDSFLTITGYQYAEVMGKSTVDLHLWAREEDRKTVVSELSNSARNPESC